MTYQQTIETIKSVIEELRPNIQMDGGDCEFVSYEDGIIYIRLHGSCRGNVAVIEHIKSLLEQHIKNHVSEVYDIIVAE